MSAPGDQATIAGPRRRRTIPAAVRLLQAAARSRIVMILFLAVLGLDLASSGICCADGPSALTARSTISSGDSGSSGDTVRHFDDDCFCCAHSVATATYKPVCLEAFAFAIQLTPPSSALADLPPPYHPPQARA